MIDGDGGVNDDEDDGGGDDDDEDGDEDHDNNIVKLQMLLFQVPSTVTLLVTFLSMFMRWYSKAMQKSSQTCFDWLQSLQNQVNF